MDDTDHATIRYIDQAIASVRQSVDDLRTMLDARYASQVKALDAALVSAEKALTRADKELERRLDAINTRLISIERTLANHA
jgi:vacuolar-type H+-ATPase subunit B/Vma2